MNKTRRKRLNIILEQFEALNDVLAEIAEEERDAFDNLPESIQNADKGSDIEAQADALETANTDLAELISNLYE